MENKELINPQDIQIQGVIDKYLRSTVSGSNVALQEAHLDDDSLTAFTEGNLNSREASPVIRHLINCSFCRHVTTELIKLDLAFADDEVQIVVNENQPSKISEVLSNLLSRIFGSNEGVVFAHEEKDADEESQKEPEVTKK